MSTAEWIGSHEIEWAEVEHLEVRLSADISKDVNSNIDPFLSQVKDLRARLEGECSVTIPLVRFRDFPTLREASFEVYVQGSIVWHEILPDKNQFVSRVFEVLEYLAVKYAEYFDSPSGWRRTIEKPLQKLQSFFGM